MNPRLLASLLAGVLGATGVLVVLRGDECVTADGYRVVDGVSQPVTLDVRGVEVSEEGAVGDVVVVKVGKPYACSVLKPEITVYAEAALDAPTSGAACRAVVDTAGDCEWLHGRGPGVWGPAPYDTTLAAETWRGPCLPSIAAEHGAITATRGAGYGLAAGCRKKAKVEPVGEVVP